MASLIGALGVPSRQPSCRLYKASRSLSALEPAINRISFHTSSQRPRNATTGPVEIAALSSKDLRPKWRPKSAPAATISQVQYLSSYNWIEDPNPTIAVPGSPPRWSHPSFSPFRLPKDSGWVYIAQNAARHPASPMEPLFRALYLTQPDFDIRGVDIVTDRNNIRKLLSFINPALGKRGVLEEFTINIERQKQTLLLSRTEKATTEFFGPNDFGGFGHEFEKAATQNQVSGSTGHWRIILYAFEELSCVVRYETDGYVEATGPGTPARLERIDGYELAKALEPLGLKSAAPPSVAPASAQSALSIRKQGQSVPMESILEMKTRAANRPIDLQELMPQLWVSQTPQLVRAHHRNGWFQQCKPENITPALQAWEKEHQADLRRLGLLLKWIGKMVPKSGQKAVLRYDSRREKLVMTRVERPDMLPSDLYGKWVDEERRR
ncbi:hypothetical protein BO71DRAFT_399806 [Aspergillus ellipticus CBS 707.79]|uniref:Geranylgeranyl pyrophosphate synthetase n=1 Tax=Aspergillus ellipticus CBS 707.79 TaxID=1448320 RepID=A0A319ER17_9EURO|nr:hypothetical protein BO71DRAFT_399806 [Aspergillus ellipticus CBS 707.79]